MAAQHSIRGGFRKRLKVQKVKTLIPNMSNLAFNAAANAARLNLSGRFISFPSDDELKTMPEAAGLRNVVAQCLKGVPRRFRRSWRKMLSRAFPELENCDLDQMLIKLVVRCWRLRATAKPYALHDFVEFCAGEGNLTMACLMHLMHGVALDIAYQPDDHNMLTRVGLRVWIDTISETNVAAMVWWGTRCSSFVGMSRRYHNRRVDNGYWGDCRYDFVRVGNMMQVPFNFSKSLFQICNESRFKHHC